MRVLVAGVGNVLRGDDGFGVEVIRRLRSRAEEFHGVEFAEYGIAGIPFVQDVSSGFDGVVLVDAARVGGAPGTVRVFEPRSSDGERLPLDLHQADPARALRLAESFGTLPSRICVVACEPMQVDELTKALSPAVEAAVPEAIRRIEQILESWLQCPCEK